MTAKLSRKGVARNNRQQCKELEGDALLLADIVSPFDTPSVSEDITCNKAKGQDRYHFSLEVPREEGVAASVAQ